MKNPNQEALMAGPGSGKLEIKVVMGMSVYKLIVFYREFFMNVFNLEIDYSDSMIIIADSRKYLPIFVPASFLCSLGEPRGSANDSFAHAYVALTPAFEEPFICKLENIVDMQKTNRLLTAREGFIFYNFLRWLTGEALNPRHILLTGSFYQSVERAGVYFDNRDGYAKISSDLLRLVESGYQPCCRFEKSGER